MRSFRFLCAASLASLPAVAAAQASENDGGTLSLSSTAEERTPPGPAGQTVNFLRDVAFDLAVDPDESKASVQVGGYTNRVSGDTRGLVRETNESWLVKLTVPVGGGDDLTSSSTLDALANGPKLTLNYSIFGSRSPNLFSSRFNEIMAEARTACAARLRAVAAAADQPADADAIARCDNAGPDPEFADDFSSASDRQIRQAILSPIRRVGLEASIGVKRYGYFTAPSLDKLHQTRFQFSAGVFAALYPSDGASAWIARADYENAYEARDDTVICRAVVVNPGDDCVSGAPAPPRNIERLNFSLQHQRVFDLGDGRGLLAIAPKGTIDALSGDYSVELPVYYIPPGDSRIAPGFTIGYSSEKDEFQFGLFLRATFSFAD